VVYEGTVPPELVRSMETLYQSAFSVVPYFDCFSSGNNLNAMALYTAGPEPVHVLVYDIGKKEATLLNELFDIDQVFLAYFIEFIFRRYPNVDAVHINRLKCRMGRLSRPHHTWRSSEDTVIDLPATFAEYQSRLGRHTRSNLNNYSNRLRRVYPDFSFNASAVGETGPGPVRKIIEMNRVRMQGKNVLSAYDGALEEKIVAFAQRYGTTNTISVNGETVAGALYYRVGDSCFLEAISHDPAYNKDRVGQVCLFLTIKNALEQGCKAFHLLWGEYEYKYRLLGVKQEIFFTSVYRSHWHKLLNFPKLVSWTGSFLRTQIDYHVRKYIINPCRRSL